MDRLAALDPQEMQTWRETGNLPERSPVEPPEDDDEPEPAASVTPTGSAPAPAVSKRQQRINDQIREAVEKATRETTAELARLRAAQPPARPEPRTAPAAVAPSVDPADPEPDPNDIEKYPGGEYDPKFIRQAAAWDIRQEQRKHEQAARARALDEQEEQAFRTSAKAASDAWEKKIAADPEFKTRLDQGLMARLIPASQIPKDPTTGERLYPIRPEHVIAQEMLDHPDTAPDVAEYLSTHPEDVARFTALDRMGVPLMPVRQLIRELGRIEGALSRGAEPLPLPNTITDAPAPPTTLGDRASAPSDPVESALKRGDTAAYIREMNARELAAARK